MHDITIPDAAAYQIKRLRDDYQPPDGNMVFRVESKHGITRNYVVKILNGEAISANRQSYLSRFFGWITGTHTNKTSNALLLEVRTAMNAFKASVNVLDPNQDPRVTMRQRADALEERYSGMEQRALAKQKIESRVRELVVEQFMASPNRIALNEMIDRVSTEMKKLGISYKDRYATEELIEAIYCGLLEEPEMIANHTLVHKGKPEVPWPIIP